MTVLMQRFQNMFAQRLATNIANYKSLLGILRIQITRLKSNDTFKIK